MRAFPLMSVILLGCSGIWAQEQKVTSIVPVSPELENYKKISINNERTKNPSDKKTEPPQNISVVTVKFGQEKLQFANFKTSNQQTVKEGKLKETNINDTSQKTGRSKAVGNENFHWIPALIQSGIFLAIQHGFRMTEEKTRREMTGPFFKDWKASTKNLRRWDDGGKDFTNYVAHPMQGAITGRIFINNSDRAKKQQFGASKAYWTSRLKVMIWSAVWSTQFEMGLISEASLGNVGQKLDGNGKSKLTWEDLIITPIAGTGFVIIEDVIDRYVLKNWMEQKIKNKLMVKILRSLLTPNTSFANLLRGKVPWKRDDRFN